MKALLIAFLLSTVSAFASTGETRTLSYNGSGSDLSAVLRGEETHTEYRYEQRHSICYRTVVVGYRTICTGGPNPRGPRQCYREPVYGTQSYPCVITVTVPYEVKDYDTQAIVNLKVLNPSNEQTTGESFKLVLNGSNLNLEATGSRKFLLQLVDSNIQTRISGNLKTLEANYTVELIPAAPALSAIKVGELWVENNKFYVGMAPLLDPAHFSFSLTLTQVRIGRDIVLFDRVLTSNEYTIEGSGSDTTAVVDYEKLGVNLSGGKFRLTPVLSFKAVGKTLNASEFEGRLEASSSLLYTNR